MIQREVGFIKMKLNMSKFIYLELDYHSVPIERWNYNHFPTINRTQVLPTNNYYSLILLVYLTTIALTRKNFFFKEIHTIRNIKVLRWLYGNDMDATQRVIHEKVMQRFKKLLIAQFLQDFLLIHTLMEMI